MKISDLTQQGATSVDINSLLQQSQPSTFRRVLGGVVGGATNLVAPGLGNVLGGAISGSSALGNTTGIQGALSSDSVFFLQLQAQLEQESRLFNSVSAVLETRHKADEGAINAIRQA
jgi:hypothetical protein